jgi:D-amino peptidase
VGPADQEGGGLRRLKNRGQSPISATTGGGGGAAGGRPPPPTTVAVKRSFGRYSARNIPPVRAREMIEDGAKRALADLKAVKPYDPGRPCEITVEFTGPDGAAKYVHRPGVEVVEPRKIVSRADDWWQAWRQFFF